MLLTLSQYRFRPPLKVPALSYRWQFTVNSLEVAIHVHVLEHFLLSKFEDYLHTIWLIRCVQLSIVLILAWFKPANAAAILKSDSR